jgi:hypothetical protein
MMDIEEVTSQTPGGEFEKGRVSVMGHVHIAHTIGSVRQTGEYDCWAASLAMVAGQRQGRHLWVSDIRRIAADAHVGLDSYGALRRDDAANAQRLANALGLRFHNLRATSFNIPLIERLLRPGRLAILGDFEYSGVQRFHVIAVYRLFGDETGTGTTVSLIDPSVGRYTNMAWNRFYDADEGRSFLVDPHFVIGH